MENPRDDWTIVNSHFVKAIIWMAVDGMENCGLERNNHTPKQ